jgi:phospholipase C
MPVSYPSRSARRRAAAACGLAALTAVIALPNTSAASASASAHHEGARSQTTSPIKHVVVIYGENVSFDHYFATYPNAANISGEKQQGSGQKATAFTASRSTPRGIDTLQNAGLLAPNNPNSQQPSRLTPAQAVTCDQDHEYTAEQKAYNNGLMNRFVEFTSKDACGANQYGSPGLTMDYYDGNTVTGLWNYAQNYAMSDRSFSSTFGPSTPGALNLISGQTHGVTEFDAAGKPVATPASGDYAIRVPNAAGVGTMTGDPDPVYDDCSNKSHTTNYTLAGMQGKNVGDLLNEKNVSWGWFQGGFAPTTAATATTPAACTASHVNAAGATVTDYSPHHQPFQYYASTANPHHLAPASTAEIGHSGQANHQYDLTAFNQVVNTDSMPAVSFLKAGMYQDGHAAYSDPLDEQKFIAETVNTIQKSKNWESTAIVLAYDDSDGWYDHVAATITNASNSSDDAAICTSAAARGVPALGGYQDRCGPGPRQPLIVVSPYAKRNFVDHTVTTQASITKFIEDNWRLGRLGDSSFDATAGSLSGLFDFHGRGRPERILLDPASGAVSQVIHGRSRTR